MQLGTPTGCPICGADGAEFWNRLGEDVTVKCPICGDFTASIELAADIDQIVPPEIRPYLSAATRQTSEMGHPLRLDRRSARGLAETLQRTTVGEKLDKLLAYVANKATSPGQWISIRPDLDYPLAVASGQFELLEYLNHLTTERYLKSPAQHGIGTTPFTYTPTIKGWRHLEPAPRPGGEPGRCFVASWLDDQMDEPYRIGINPAVRACGFTPIWMKDIPENKGITDRILSEIRRAEFIVADFTGQRQSVYFEAGFARGLGREVIWCCRRDEVGDLHFDIRHFGHVVWDTPADLSEKLQASIRANIIKRT